MRKAGTGPGWGGGAFDERPMPVETRAVASAADSQPHVDVQPLVQLQHAPPSMLGRRKRAARAEQSLAAIPPALQQSAAVTGSGRHRGVVCLFISG